MSKNLPMKNPFIIQCKLCKLIIADSFTLIDYKHNHLIFTKISSICNTSIKKQENTNKNDFDYNCQYNLITCDCKNIVGKKYVTVNRECMMFVDKYAIDREQVISYELSGSIDGSKCLGDLGLEVERIKKFCVYLYNKNNKNE